MNFTKENIYNELFADTTRISEEFMHEFMQDHSGDCVDRIQEAEEEAIEQCFVTFAKQFNTDVKTVKKFIADEQSKVQRVYDELMDEMQSISHDYEMGCLISSEFTPQPTYESTLKIIEKHGIDLQELRIFFQNDQEWSSIESMIQYEMYNKSK